MKSKEKTLFMRIIGKIQRICNDTALAIRIGDMKGTTEGTIEYAMPVRTYLINRGLYAFLQEEDTRQFPKKGDLVEITMNNDPESVELSLQESAAIPIYKIKIFNK